MAKLSMHHKFYVLVLSTILVYKNSFSFEKTAASIIYCNIRLPLEKLIILGWDVFLGSDVSRTMLGREYSFCLWVALHVIY